MKSILSKCYLYWAFFWFIIYMVALSPFLVLPYYFFTIRRALAISYRFMQVWGSVFNFPILGIKYHYKGQKNIPKKGKFIAVANHNSLLDTPAIVCGLNRPIKFLAKSSLMKVPVFGFVYKHLVIPVDRQSHKSKGESLKLMRALLNKEVPLLIFPEGVMNRNESNNLQVFQLGAFSLAISEEIPVLPIVVKGTSHCLNSTGLELKSGTITVEFLPIVSPDFSSSPQIFMEQCRALMQQTLYTDGVLFPN
jgi:1-acyl-sn-glycerol-3-phosphate acyltransferase